MSQDIQLYAQLEATPVGHSVRDRVMAERVAVLGTGIMGAPMARNLLNTGFQVRVWNRTPDKARVLAADGADLAETPADAVREAAFVITMLTDTDAVLAVMGQAAESVPDGALWLQTGMDTDVERVAALAKDHGFTFVDCPVIGTRETAKQGRLVVLASGPGDALDRAQPIFDAIGSKTVRLEPEAGGMSRMKLVVSAWTTGIVESLRAQLGRAARWARSRTSAGRERQASVTRTECASPSAARPSAASAPRPTSTAGSQPHRCTPTTRLPRRRISRSSAGHAPPGHHRTAALSGLLRAELAALAGARAGPCPHFGEAIDRCPRRGYICCAAPTARFTRVGPSIWSADLRVTEPSPRVATRRAGCPSSLRTRCRCSTAPPRAAGRAAATVRWRMRAAAAATGRPPEPAQPPAATRAMSRGGPRNRSRRYPAVRRRRTPVAAGDRRRRRA